MRHHAWAVALCSVLVLVPCFWHRHLEANDLGSHVYNAWLVQLIHQGKAPELHIVPQSNNVLFDLMLSGLFRLGPRAAECIATSAAVLIFFWGGFALCAAAAGRPTWAVAPVLAMTAYGFVFNMGFFNLYLSVGLSLFVLALAWRGRRWDFLLIPPLMALVWMAHLLGAGGVLALGGSLALMRVLPLRWQPALTTAMLGAYFAVRWYVLHHHTIVERESDIYWLGGADQFVVFRKAYLWVALAVVLLAAATIALGVLRDRREALQRGAAWVQLYVVVALAVGLAPGGIFHPKLGMMGYLPDRVSIYAAVLACCLLALARPTKWQAAAFSAVAIVFFSLLYADTAALDQLETRMEQVVAPMRPGQRVLATIFSRRGARVHDQHMIDRACIGHCFYVANYEPSSGQFRVKAEPGSPVVMSDQENCRLMQNGLYQVRAQDLPLLEIYGCGASLRDICVHELQAGDLNGEAAFAQIGVKVRR
ncbi:MAG: hypothetical protein WA188_02650 [Terriglobales bacterium]